MIKRWKKSVLAIVVSAAAGAAGALPFTLNNVFVSTGVGTVLEYTPTGTLVQTLAVGTSFITGSAFDSSGNFYATRFANNAVQRFDSGGNNLGTFGGGYSTPESVVINAAGNVLVGSLGGTIRRFDSSGNFLNQVNPGRVDFMDLAADQTTMLFTQEGGEVKRVNLATGVVLSDFSTDVERAFALRIRSDGSVLVADGADIELLDATGVQIGSYDMLGIDNWFGLNLDPDGTSFWSAGTGGRIARFDIATGMVLTSWDVVGTNGTWGLAIYGEVTQGGGGRVPEPGVLGLMAVALLALGLTRVRLRA